MSKISTITKEELEAALIKSFDKSSLAANLGYMYLNGKLWKQIEEQLNKYSLSICHFDPAKKNRERRKYELISKVCPICTVSFETLKGHRKELTTCSHSCSNIYFAQQKHTEESKLKTSRSLKEHYDKVGRKPFTQSNRPERNCVECGRGFKPRTELSCCCSNRCVNKHNWKVPEYRANQAAKMQQRIASGQHQGWASRTKLKPSYPESYVITLLDDLNVKYERELKVGRWFIDFADSARKLALEIDGKQHELAERKASDEKKDAYLVENEWQVLRIQWKKISSEFREELLNSIGAFFKES